MRLRSATKRFEQLKTQPAVVLRLLRNILPTQFPEGTCPAISMQSVGVLLLFVFVSHMLNMSACGAQPDVETNAVGSLRRMVGRQFCGQQKRRPA